MKKTQFFSIFLFVFTIISSAQSALQNSGTIQIHDQGQIGFHTNLINNGSFKNNLGLAGFYNTETDLTISGTNTPQFYNFEVAVDDNLYLEINTEISNVLSFIYGNVVTPRDTPDISLDFLNNSFNVLEDDFRLTDGYASYNGNNEFTFPIGDNNKLRPLITPTQNNNPKYKAAYYSEDPNFPLFFSTNFDTTNSINTINVISTKEFWDFDGSNPTTVTLTWDPESDIQSITDELPNLRVVGWSKTENRWLNLGNISTTGNMNEGTISSLEFIPDNYTIITLGSLNYNVISADGITIYNIISPNNDTKNDTFYIENIEYFKNELKIYNRWGRLVYEAENYKNNWDGVSNQKVVYKKNEKLPVGTYYYVLELIEENKSYAGYVYINY